MSVLLVGAILVMVLNVCDSITTSMCMKQYPEKDLAGEANPIMRRLMLKNKHLGEIVKQGMVLTIVIVVFRQGDIAVMRVCGILLSLVVLNNLYIWVAREVTKRKVISPIRALQKICRVPDNALFYLVCALIAGLAVLINHFAFGWS